MLHKGALKYAQSSLALSSKFFVHRFGGPLCREIALKSGKGSADVPKGCRCIRESFWLDALGGAPVRKSRCFTDLLGFPQVLLVFIDLK